MKTSRIIKIPDYRLPRADEMVADRAREATNPGALVKPILERRPFQKPFTPYNPDLIRHALIERWRTDPSTMLMTDKAFHDLARMHAIARNKEVRIEERREWEAKGAREHARLWVETEDHRRQVFFLKMQHIMIERTSKQQKARRLAIAYEEFVREHTVERGVRWAKEAHDRIIKAAAKREAWLHWHLQHLFGSGPNGTIFLLPGSGRKLETVSGEAHNHLAEEATKRHLQWRRDQNFVTHPNGALVRMHNGGGDMIETVQAKLQLPLIHQRLDRFDFWHDFNFLISTPNGSMRPANKQGFHPEGAAAKREAPHVAERTEKHWDFRLGGLMQTLPNGSMTHAPRHGLAPETVTAKLYWPGRAETSAAAETWHDGHLYKETPNGGLAPLAGVGNSIERTAFEHTWPVADRRSAAADLWHETHKFKQTPNGGMAPLKGTGYSFEKASADHVEPLTHERVADAKDWHQSHRFARTPNGGFAPLKEVGGLIETAAAEAQDPVVIRRSTAFHDRYVNNRFVETPNHSIARLKGIGQRFNNIAGDVAEYTKDQITDRFEKRNALRHQHVRDAGERERQNVSKVYQEQEKAEPATGAGGTSPLPTEGHAAKVAPHDIAQHRSKLQKMKAIQKSLAGHEQSVSRLQDHAVGDLARIVPPPKGSRRG